MLKKFANEFLFDVVFYDRWGIGARIVDAELAKYIVYEELYERFLFVDDRIWKLSKVFCIDHWTLMVLFTLVH